LIPPPRSGRRRSPVSRTRAHSDLQQRHLFDHIAEEKPRRALEAVSYDGTEVHRVVDRELRGLELETAAKEIKRAVEQKLSNTIPIDAVIEFICKFFPRFAAPPGAQPG
jgi:hypothetical protein